MPNSSNFLTKLASVYLAEGLENFSVAVISTKFKGCPIARFGKRLWARSGLAYAGINGFPNVRAQWR